MLTPLGKKARPVKEPDAVDLLLECHDRIRRFTRLATWLAHADDAPSVAVKETAESVLRYFTEALPRHSADEDRSIAPRLSARRIPATVAAAVESMTRQHGTLEETLTLLIPMWRALAADPSSISKHTAAMEPLVDRLRGLWDVHLHLEEAIVFPAIRANLTPNAMNEVLAEMRARRS